MTPNLEGMQFGDTTYTKVFVGGLAWETQTDTMEKYFEQFGHILETVVITDKNTGRSKGYGFVTFREADAATRACVDPSPVIDGRRANCNLASLGIQRSKPTTPQHGERRSFRIMKSFQGGIQGGIGTAFPSTFPHYGIQPGVPYNVYGYPPYSPDYTYPTTYYNLYGGADAAAAQYPLYGGPTNNGMTTGMNNAFYPYFQFGHGLTVYGVENPQLLQYSAMNATAGVTGFADQQYGVTPTSLAPSNPAQIAGMTMAFPAPSLPPAPAAKYYYRILLEISGEKPMLGWPEVTGDGRRRPEATGGNRGEDRVPGAGAWAPRLAPRRPGQQPGHLGAQAPRAETWVPRRPGQ